MSKPYRRADGAVRHGDVILVPVDEIDFWLKDDKYRSNDLILAHGEATGHKHEIINNHETTFVRKNSRSQFLEVLRDGTILTHEEHGPVELEKGFYQVLQQRQYIEGETRRAYD